MRSDPPDLSAEHLAPHRFKPGASGNPGGRPKGRSLTARLREFLDSSKIAGMPIPGGRQVADLVVEGLVKAAAKGDSRCLALLWDRIEGKVPLKVDVTSDGQTIAEALKDLTTEELDHFIALTERIAPGGPGPAPPEAPRGEMP